MGFSNMAPPLIQPQNQGGFAMAPFVAAHLQQQQALAQQDQVKAAYANALARQNLAQQQQTTLQSQNKTRFAPATSAVNIFSSAAPGLASLSQHPSLYGQPSGIINNLATYLQGVLKSAGSDPYAGSYAQNLVNQIQQNPNAQQNVQQQLPPVSSNEGQNDPGYVQQAPASGVTPGQQQNIVQNRIATLEGRVPTGVIGHLQSELNNAQKLSNTFLPQLLSKGMAGQEGGPEGLLGSLFGGKGAVNYNKILSPAQTTASNAGLGSDYLGRTSPLQSATTSKSVLQSQKQYLDKQYIPWLQQQIKNEAAGRAVSSNPPTLGSSSSGQATKSSAANNAAQPVGVSPYSNNQIQFLKKLNLPLNESRQLALGKPVNAADGYTYQRYNGHIFKSPKPWKNSK